ncbi:MAG: hypothetical protein OXK17_08340 [Thaumarchaeota archaeon]|nr:hypothetical protein [Nitrososphaerota archaeon]
MSNTKNARIVLEGLVARMASGDLPEAIAKSYIRADDVPSAKWSRCNRILMLLSGITDARGYRQWAEAGRHVRKGVRALYILAPRVVSVKDCREDDEERKVVVGFRALPAFRYEDTDGAPLQEYEPRQMPPLFGLAAYNGIDVRYMNTAGGEYGSMSVERKSMTLSSESPDVYLHELVHWYDLRDREDRKHGQDPVQETVAQMGACALAHMYGIDAAGYTAMYVAGYAGCDKSDGEKLGRQCMRVIDRTREAIDRILEDAAAMGREAAAGPEAAGRPAAVAAVPVG